MKLNEITKEALAEAVYIAHHLGFGEREAVNSSTTAVNDDVLTRSLQIGLAFLEMNRLNKQNPLLYCPPIDGWCWGPTH